MSLPALSVRHRISIGFGIVLALLACLAVVAEHGIATVRDESASVRAMTALADATNGLVERLGVAQAQSLQYAVSENDDDRATAEAAIDAVSFDRQAFSRDGTGSVGTAIDRYTDTVRAAMAQVAGHRSDAAAHGKAATDLQTIVSAIAAALLREGSAETAPLALRLTEAARDSAGAAVRLLSSRNPADAGIARKTLDTVRATLDDLRTAAAGNNRVQRFIKAAQGPVADAAAAIDATSRHAEEFLASIDKRRQDAERLRSAAADVRGHAMQARDEAMARMAEAVDAARRLGLIAACCAMLAGVGFARAIGNGVARPIGRLTASMRALAAGDTATVVPHAGRGDEIGAMARSVQVFKDSMIDAENLRAAQDELKRTAEADRKALLGRLADGFEAGVLASLDTLAAAAPAMLDTARHMSAAAERASTEAAEVASAANDASLNVRTVAAATEQLAVSVQEIGRQVAQSTEVTGRAVTLADRTGSAVRRLTDGAQRISDVVSLINGIAGQTNLLALNATIEAARAGESGKGFAVVASEVKSLANETARATGTVAEHTAAIQAATSEVMQAIQAIGDTVGSMDQIAAMIAAAVEEQGAATREIARNVQEAAEQTRIVSGSIDRVSGATSETGVACGRVSESAETMRSQADALRASVNTFLGSVRAA